VLYTFGLRVKLSVAAATVVTMSLAARSAPAGGTGLGPVRDFGPAQRSLN